MSEFVQHRTTSDIMRTSQFDADALLPLFRRRQIVTMDEMKAALGTAVERTVFRKLQEFAYHSSYSHRGKFYTLEALAEFDDRGLWTCRGARFSRFGTLIDTAEQFVTRSDRGCLASELAGELQVPVKEPLLKLVSARRLVPKGGRWPLPVLCDRPRKAHRATASAPHPRDRGNVALLTRSLGADLGRDEGSHHPVL